VTSLRAEGRFQQIRWLTETARALTYSMSPQEVLDLTVKETAAVFATQSVALLLAQPGGKLSVSAPVAFRLRAQRELREKVEGLDERVVARVQELFAERGDSRFLAVPLVVQGRLSGVLAVGRPEDGGPGDDDEWLLSAVADQAAVSLEKLQLNETAVRAERARREREQMFQCLFDSPLVGLAFRTLDGRVVEANQAFQALTGYSRGTIESGDLRWLALTPGPPRGAGPPERAADPTPPRPFETELVRCDGQRVDVLVGAARLEEQARDIVFVMDITAQKRAQSSLRILAETSKALLGSSLDHQALFKSIAWLVVPRFADWCAVESVGEGQTIGQHVALENLSSASVEHALEWRRRFPPDPRSRAGVAEVIRSGRPQLHAQISASFLSEYTVEAGKPSELSRVGLRSAILVPMLLQGKVVGVITFVRGGIHTRFGPDDLGLAVEIARLGALAIENARLYERAQEAIGIRDDFLSVAAHELKTPLTTLQLHVDVLERSAEQAGGADEKASRRLTSVARQVDRLTRLVDGLLEVSHISAGQMALQREPCDLAEVVRSVVSQLEIPAAKAGSRLEVDLPPSPVWGLWDRLRLEQVVVNLVSNAIKYGAGEPIRVGLSPDGGRALLTVQDQGIGIAPADVERIFDRFERAVSTQHYGGLGLGLYIARQIIVAHGGEIRVSSQPARGSEFTVELPLVASAEQSVKESLA
jgi:PAS domain S-box-containing protein